MNGRKPPHWAFFVAYALVIAAAAFALGQMVEGAGVALAIVAGTGGAIFSQRRWGVRTGRGTPRARRDRSAS